MHRTADVVAPLAFEGDLELVVMVSAHFTLTHGFSWRAGRPAPTGPVWSAERSTDALLVLDRCNTDGMPTDIYFAGENVRVRVDEDPGEVAEAFKSAGGLPLRLTGQGHRRDVFINPATVAFWSASESSSEPVPQDPPPPSASDRQAVTDIWGKPLRKKPRR